MPRFHRSPNGRRNFRNTFAIEQGGTGADTLQGRPITLALSAA